MILALTRQRQEDHCKSKASLDYKDAGLPRETLFEKKKKR